MFCKIASKKGLFWVFPNKRYCKIFQKFVFFLNFYKLKNGFDNTSICEPQPMFILTGKIPSWFGKYLEISVVFSGFVIFEFVYFWSFYTRHDLKI
jgi:hypothetical protein